MTQAKLTDQLQIAYMQGKANAQREMMIGFDGAGNKPGEDGPYRPPDKKDVPGVPPGYPHIPKPTKLASDPYRDNKAGNVDEVWDLTGPRQQGPMPKSFYDAVDKIRMSLPVKKADAQGLSDVLSPHQNPRSGSLKDSGLTDEQKIQLLIRGAAAHKA